MKCFILLCVLCSSLSVVRGQNEAEREAKLFPLFNIIKFDNFPCSSSNREGVCLTSKECVKKNGTAFQGCAMGYGVCCAFNTTCDGITSEKSTVFQNENYPRPETMANMACIVKVRMNNPDICQIRLDFDELELLPPVEGLCEDGENIQVAANNIMALGIDKLCGKLSGQHIYLHFSRSLQPSAVHIMLRTRGGASNVWKIRINQIDCSRQADDYLRAPEGCLQYYSEPMGFIRSFNFDSSDKTSYLAENNYMMCIRRPVSSQCVEYMSNKISLVEGVSTSCTDLPITGFLPKTQYTDYLIIQNDVNPSLFCGLAEGFQNVPGPATTSIRNSGPGPYQLRFLTDKTALNDRGGFEIKYLVRDIC